MEKLTYERIADVTLKINLHNGYEVVALARHNFESKKYEVSLYVKDSLIDDLMLMEDFENITINATNKFICPAILKYVSKNFESGNFNKYISRCNYYQKCFEVGEEMTMNMVRN